jgi:hypothetical protein
MIGMDIVADDEAGPDPLVASRSRFDAMLANMQTAEARAAVDVLFTATPAELGAAAVQAAIKTDWGSE